jgi:hypothetical protein
MCTADRRRRRTALALHNGRSALAAGTALDAPLRTFAAHRLSASQSSGERPFQFTLRQFSQRVRSLRGTIAAAPNLNALFRNNSGRLTVKTNLIAFLPEHSYSIVAFLFSPLTKTFPFSQKFKKRHPEPTRGQHHTHIQIEKLPRPRDRWKECGKVLPVGVSPVHDTGITIRAHNHRLRLEGTPHKCHAGSIKEVCCSFVFRSG